MLFIDTLLPYMMCSLYEHRLAVVRCQSEECQLRVIEEFIQGQLWRGRHSAAYIAQDEKQKNQQVRVGPVHDRPFVGVPVNEFRREYASGA